MEPPALRRRSRGYLRLVEAQPEPPAQSRVNVLIVDDEPHLFRYLESGLARSNHDLHLEHAWHTTEAASRLRDAPGFFDLVSVDPGGTTPEASQDVHDPKGGEICLPLLRDPLLRSSAKFIVTSRLAHPDIVYSFSRVPGVHGYCVKDDWWRRLPNGNLQVVTPPEKCLDELVRVATGSTHFYSTPSASRLFEGIAPRFAETPAGDWPPFVVVRPGKELKGSDAQMLISALVNHDSKALRSVLNEALADGLPPSLMAKQTTVVVTVATTVSLLAAYAVAHPRPPITLAARRPTASRRSKLLHRLARGDSEAEAATAVGLSEKAVQGFVRELRQELNDHTSRPPKLSRLALGLTAPDLTDPEIIELKLPPQGPKVIPFRPRPAPPGAASSKDTAA